MSTDRFYILKKGIIMSSIPCIDKYIAQSGILKRTSTNGTKQNFSDSGNLLKRKIRVYYVRPKKPAFGKEENKKSFSIHHLSSKATDKFIITTPANSYYKSTQLRKKSKVDHANHLNFAYSSTANGIGSTSNTSTKNEEHNSDLRLKPTVKSERNINIEKPRKIKQNKYRQKVKRIAHSAKTKKKLSVKASRTRHSPSENNFVSTSPKNETETITVPLYSSTKIFPEVSSLNTSAETELENETSSSFFSTVSVPKTEDFPLYNVPKSEEETKYLYLNTSTNSEEKTSTVSLHTTSNVSINASSLYTFVESEQEAKTLPFSESNVADYSTEKEKDETSLLYSSFESELGTKTSPLSESKLSGLFTTSATEVRSYHIPTKSYLVTNIWNQTRTTNHLKTESSKTSEYFGNNVTEIGDAVSVSDMPQTSENAKTNFPDILELQSFTSEIPNDEATAVQKSSFTEYLNAENDMKSQKSIFPAWNVMETSTNSGKETTGHVLGASNTIFLPYETQDENRARLSVESTDGHETENRAVIFTNITRVRHLHDNQNNLKLIEYETINETETEIAHQIVQFFEENVTSSDGLSYFYLNVSKSELKIIIPLLKNGSLSIYDIENRLIESGYFKNISHFRDHFGVVGLVTFCEWVRLCLKEHIFHISIAFSIVILVILLLLLMCFLKRRRLKPHKQYSGVLEETRYTAAKSEKTPTEREEIHESSSSSSDSKEISTLPSFQKQARKSIQMVDNLLNLGRTVKQEKQETKRLLSSSSEESEGEKEETEMAIRKPVKRTKPTKEDKTKRLPTEKRGKFEEIKLVSSESSEEKDQRWQKLKSKPKKKVPEDSEKADKKRKKKLEPKTSKKFIQSSEKSEGRDDDPRRRKDKPEVLQTKRQARFEDADVKESEEEVVIPTVRRLSRWMQRVFKTPRQEETGGEGEDRKDSFQEPSILSSEEVDKTYTSRRQKLLTFVSPSKRKKVKRFRARTKKSILAAPVRAVVSESDFSSEVVFPPVDSVDLKSRIVATGDCKKIDHMLVRGDWERSFYTAHDIEMIGEHGGNLQLHEPAERRKMDVAKIVDSQAQMLGTLSKSSSTHSLQDVVGRSMHRAESTACSPRAMTNFDLKTRRRT